MKKLLISICWLLTLHCSATEIRSSIIVDGTRRDFIVYIPAALDSNNTYPAIISLHGRLGTAEGQLKFADFRSLAESEKFIIICPQGINRSWNDGRGTPAHQKGIDDVKFIDELIDHIINSYHIDSKRIYLTGMSNGGFMSSRLACQLNSKIAAIAVVGASMDKNEGYQAQWLMPALYIQGTSDPLVPFSGGRMKNGAGGEIYGHEEVLKTWASVNGCNLTPTITDLPVLVSDGTSIRKEVFSGPSGIQVVGFTIFQGGHTWPGGTQYLPKAIIGSLSHNMNACNAIWDFFKQYRKN